MTAVVLVVILVMSVVCHEVAHGAVAERLGDPTARRAGRLTLNPLRHLDPVGSVLLPAVLVLSGSSIVFGWARPVPYNPAYLRPRRWGPALVALAGPMANIGLAVVFGLAIRAGMLGGPLVRAVVAVNLVLAIFNLIPIPPLDGSRLLFPFLPPAYRRAYARLQAAGIVLAVGLVYVFGGTLLWPAVRFLFRLVTGMG